MNALRTAVVALVVTASLAVAPVAFAVDSTADGYGGVAGNTEEQVAQNPSDRGSSSPGAGANNIRRADDAGSSLPFTGLDIAIIAIVGGSLVGLGLVMRAVIRRQHTTA